MNSNRRRLAVFASLLVVGFLMDAVVAQSQEPVPPPITMDQLRQPGEKSPKNGEKGKTTGDYGCSVPKEWGKFIGTTPAASMPHTLKDIPRDFQSLDFSLIFEDDHMTLRFISAGLCMGDGIVNLMFTVKRN